MSLPDQTPKLPKLPFIIADVVLLGVAWYFVYESSRPFTTNVIVGVIACVGLAGLLGAIPFFADYARKQDEALDDRQRGLEALARTATTAAEQTSIAANGLQEITDLLHRNLKHAEQLPHKLQEKIAEFKAQLDNVRDDDREELEKELIELRASESERLQAVTEKIHRAVAELTKLDAAAHQRMAERAETLDRANASSAKRHADAVAALNEASAAFTREIAAAQARALDAINLRLSERTAAAVATIEASVAAAAKSVASHLPATPLPTTTPEASPATASQPIDPAADVAAPPKRPRKARRENLPDGETAATAVDDSLVGAAPASAPPDVTASTTGEPAPIHNEPRPAAEAIAPEISPVVPSSSAPISPDSPRPSDDLAPVHLPVSAAAPSPDVSADSNPLNPPDGERLPRKRLRKPAPEPSADLTLELGGGEFSSPAFDDSPVTSAESIERVISSDGATRLIATAYIGIGNRLFVRGDGPGLSWEKGVPLQFVSIGKWRWETAEATAPITVKLYKNDEIECSALGALTLDPGHQQEVSAKF